MNIVEIKNTNISIDTKNVLEAINFDLKKGEMKFLIGKTGSGKSSLMKTLYGELQLEEGEGHFAEFNFKKLKRKHIPLMRRKIGIVFQDFQLLTDRNVEKNLSFVLEAPGANSVIDCSRERLISFSSPKASLPLTP